MGKTPNSKFAGSTEWYFLHIEKWMYVEKSPP